MNKTKEHLLRCAFQKYLDPGVHAVSMNEIIRASGLTKGAFYHYFPSKEALFDETLERFFFSYFEKFPFQSNPEVPFREKLEEARRLGTSMFQEIAQVSGNPRNLANYYILLLHVHRHHSGFSERMVRYFERFKEYLEVQLRQGIASGEVRDDLDPALMADHLYSLMEGILLTGIVDDPAALEPRTQKLFAQLHQLLCPVEVSDSQE